MKIILHDITDDLLSDIIENIGSLSITNCESHIDDDQLLFDIYFVESVQALLTKAGVQIIKNERKMFIDACRFSHISGV